MCAGKCCTLFWELRPCLFLLFQGFLVINRMDYRVPLSTLKEKFEKKKSEYFWIYIFSNKLIYFLCSFISSLVSCEEIIIKQKLKFHLRNKNLVCSFFYYVQLHFFTGLGKLRPVHFLVHRFSK